MATFLLPLAFVIRILLGMLFVVHGFPKVSSPERATSLFWKLGVPYPKISAALVAAIEFFGGIALILGFATRFSSALLAAVMLAAAYKRQTKLKESCWFEALLAAALIALAILGAGDLGSGYWSIDERFGWFIGW